MTCGGDDGCVRVRGARENNLRAVDVDIPRDSFVVFTGVSGSGKSSLAFGTLYAEAQRRYFESVAPYARRLIQQVAAPRVDEITGLPPAVALQQRLRAPSSRSTVGTLTTLSNLLRLLYSRAGTYPRGAAHLEAEAFSPNTAAGACPECHGLGRVHRATEELMVPDPALSIREGAIAAWPGGWQGRNLRDVVTALGIDVDAPWRRLPKRKREFLLFSDEQPIVLVTPEEDRDEWEYNGRFWSADAHLRKTLLTSSSEAMKQRALRFMDNVACPVCGGSGLRPDALRVRFVGKTIADVNRMQLADVRELLAPTAAGEGRPAAADDGAQAEAATRLCRDLVDRIGVLLELGLGYLSLGRATTTLSPGEMQRLRIATQLRSGLFGVVYVLDEPSAGLHPADAEPLLTVLERLKQAGNSLFVVEHDMDVVRRADWVVDVGPGPGEAGGRVLYSGPVDGLTKVRSSVTRRFVFGERIAVDHAAREPIGCIELRDIRRHNLRGVDVEIPLGVLTAVTGVSGSGKSTLVTHVLAEAVRAHLGTEPIEDEGPDAYVETETTEVKAVGLEVIDRMVQVDQRPIGRTPRSNLATYTGLFDAVRKEFAATKKARARRYNAGRFSFNVASGRCQTCQGDGFVAVELIFLPSTYAPCPACKGSRYNDQTLQITYRGKNIADVLAMTVDEAAVFFEDVPGAARSLATLQEVGVGYLRLGQSATELSGGEAQRIKLASELQRSARGHVLYLLDEPTSGLHPADVEVLLRQLHRLVDNGHSVVVVEHDMDVVASADWVIDLGPGGGDAGGRVVAAGRPAQVARTRASITAPYLKARLAG
ncbi:MAG: excinuclease subunit [Actinomycetota bacterium]|nr:excinuclease subunit [Actinomycetota bacterium]